MNKLLLGALLMSASASQALEVTDVVARQRWPWNNLVDVTFTVSGAESSETFYKADLSAVFPGVSGDRLVAKTLVDEPVVKGNGTFRLVWDMGADAPGLVTTNLSVQVSVAPMADSDPMYLVIDLSEGAAATSYPYHYTTTPPDLSKDDCRTKELWLKRCPAGTFLMGSQYMQEKRNLPEHQVTLTKPFYLGVFEITQEQWYRVKGNWPSKFANETYRATRPVETILPQDISRNISSSNKTWYDTPVSTVADNSFMALIRAKTGFSTADLPTEAQWEYACRGGTTTVVYTDPTLARTNPWTVKFEGRNEYDSNKGSATEASDLTAGTTKVGSYSENPWGFYDMYGNVAELCGDGNPYNDSDTKQHTDSEGIVGVARTDPRSCSVSYETDKYSGAGTTRGGSWFYDWTYMTSGARCQIGNSTSSVWGFRLAITAQ